MQLSPEVEFILALAGLLLAVISVYATFKRLPN
jgi:hypothetical protein